MKLAMRVGAEGRERGSWSQKPGARSLKRKRVERRAGSAESRERGDVETMELQSGGCEAEEEETDPKQSSASSHNPVYA